MISEPGSTVKESQPTVSVVIPTYNYGRFIAGAIESALAQTLKPLEIIVVDDGSTDNTPEVVAPFKDRIQYIRKANGGASSARNARIDAARGDLIAFLDADDYWRPNKLERQVPSFADPKVGMVQAGSRVFDSETGETSCDTRPPAEFSFHDLMNHNAVSTTGSIIRRSIFEQTGKFDLALHGPEDWDMWLRITAAGWRLVGIPEVLLDYRMHTSSLSTSNPLRHYRHCVALLKKSLKIHPGCATCREAVRTARIRLAFEMYLQMSARARAHFRHGERWDGFKWRIRSVFHYPEIVFRIPGLLRERRRHSIQTRLNSVS